MAEIKEAIFPAASWLLQHDLAYETNLRQAPNLLMAYALNLDPAHHQEPSLPTPVIDPSTGRVNLSFQAAQPGITYQVEASSDLQTWTTDGVMLSDIGEDGQRTASVEPDGPQRFMRLVVHAE